MGDDEWDALEHYLRAGAELAAEIQRDAALERLAAAMRMSSAEEAPA